MRIFVLEDKPERIITFHEALKGATVNYIQTANRWQEFEPPYDYVFLDHDLGGRELETHSDCGLTFLVNIQRHYPIKGPIILHTLNSQAAQRMMDYLRSVDVDAVWMPFWSPEFQSMLAQIGKELWG